MCASHGDRVRGAREREPGNGNGTDRAEVGGGIGSDEGIQLFLSDGIRFITL